MCSDPDCDKPVHSGGRCGTHHSQWYRGRNTHEIECEGCGRRATVHQRGQRFCSLVCSSRVNGPRARARSAELAREARVAKFAIEVYTGPKNIAPPIVHTKGSGRLTCGACRVCDAWFIDSDANITCSDECRDIHRRQRKRIQQDRRRARKRDAYVADVYRREVFELDDYVCHLCDEPTDPGQVVPHPRAPTIDHVIPLANGGTHEPANCRTACFICNARKSNRVAAA